MKQPELTSYYVPSMITEKAISLTCVFYIGIDKYIDVWFPKSLCIEKDGTWAVKTWFFCKKIEEVQQQRYEYAGRREWLNAFNYVDND